MSDSPTSVFDGVLRSFLQKDQNVHHLLSFDYLVGRQVQEVVSTYGTVGTLLQDTKYAITVENITVQPDESTPVECHSYGQNYTLSVLGDIVLTTPDIPDSLVYRVKTTVARLPLMTGRTSLSSCLDVDPYPIVGAFIVRGKLRTIPVTKVVAWDVPILMIRRKEKYIQVRSRHPHKAFRSTSTVEFRMGPKKADMEGVIVCRLAFQKSDLHVSVLAQGLGCDVGTFIRLIRQFAGTQYERHIFRRYEVSMGNNRWSSKCWDVTSAELCISKIYKKTTQSTGHNILLSETFPHIRCPEDPEKERRAKVLYLAYCVTLLILVSHDKVPEEELPLRDDFSQSQLQSASSHLGGLFRLLFISHIRTCGKLLRRALMKIQAPAEVRAAQLDLVKVFGEHRLSSRIMSAVASGVWSQLRKGVSMALNNNNEDSVAMQLRRVSSSLTTTDGTHTRPRNVMRDQYGFICASYTPDGEMTGLVYELACTATSTPPVPDRSIVLRVILEECADVFVPSEEAFYGAESGSRPAAPGSALLMGPSGCIEGVVTDKDEFLRRFYGLRRTLAISPFTFINYQNATALLQIQQDEGFLCRPLVVADRLGDITPTLDFPTALRNGIVEYVNVREQATICNIAVSARSFVAGQTTHVELTQASILGQMCGSAPFVTAQQGPRNSYFGSQKKQAITADPKDRRGGVGTTQLWHSHRSLVSAKTERMVPGHDELRATPLVLAFLSVEGVEEDAVVFSKAAAERGAMLASTARTYQSEAPPPNSIFSEIFERPGEVIAKKNVDYSAVGADGLPRRGAYIKGGDVVIGKTRSVKKQIGKIATKQQKFMLTRRDISSTSRPDESGFVTGSCMSTLPTGTRAVVDVTTTRELIVGDKLASRYAQKSTISSFWPQEDLPVSMVTGMSPDIIASPLSLTSRMTMASMIEAVTGKAVALSGDLSVGVDRQEFDAGNGEHVRRTEEVLKAHGFHPTGKEKFLDGRTGEPIEGLVFVGVVDYLRLIHLASKKAYARSVGRRDCLTRQAKDGRRIGGGLRFGEMELSAVAAHGGSVNLQHRFREFSDVFIVYACKKCSYLVDESNPDVDFFFCNRCHSRDHVRRLKLPFTFLVLILELMSTGVLLKLDIKDDAIVDVHGGETADDLRRSTTAAWPESCGPDEAGEEEEEEEEEDLSDIEVVDDNIVNGDDDDECIVDGDDDDGTVDGDDDGDDSLCD